MLLWFPSSTSHESTDLGSLNATMVSLWKDVSYDCLQKDLKDAMKWFWERSETGRMDALSLE